MNTKLTLTVEREVIDRAKKYAQSKGRSLSDIVENYLKSLTKEPGRFKSKTSPITNSLRGTFKVPEEMDYKKELRERLSEKYL